jgi:dipeptidyl aminopeptidase/acylaminoacyl peptidase
MVNRRTFVQSAMFVALASGLAARMRTWARSSGGRPFSWSDAANRWNPEHAVISEDGGAIALQVRRPLSAGGKFLGPSWGSLLDTRSDLWLMDGKLGRPAPLSALAGGAWSPWFSPDGKRLSALTLVGPGKVGMAVWDLSRGTYRIFSHVNVELFLAKFRTHRSAWGAPTYFFEVPRQYLWLDETSILFVERGSGAPPSLVGLSGLSSTLLRMRRRTADGKLSVRVWDRDSSPCGAGSRLVRLSCNTGKVETLYEGDVRGVSLSPDRRCLAVMVATGNIHPVPNEPMHWPLMATSALGDEMVRLKLSLIDLMQAGSARDIEGVAAVGNVAPSRLPQWSTDGSRIAVPVRTTYSDAPSTGNDAAWEVTARTGAARKWSATSALDAELIAALLTTEALNEEAIIKHRPHTIRPQDYLEYGQIQGGAWQCTPWQVMFWNAPTLTLISATGMATVPGRFTSVHPPVVGDSATRVLAQEVDGRTLLLTAVADRHRVDVLSARQTSILLALNPACGSAVYTNDTSRGTFLILERPGQPARSSPLSFNAYFSNVVRPRRRMVVHAFPDGSVRSGLLQLPIDHRPGDRHPVIMWAYPNATPAISDSFSRANSSANVVYPVQYLLTKGFAFFEAPFPCRGKLAAEPMRAAVDAVLPWLDVLARQPEIKPQEYGFFGHSNAGYVALALEASTDRFKAIVAWDTFPELGYDTLHSVPPDETQNCAANLIQGARMLYEDPTQPYAPQPAPPWRHAAAYIRNEPLFNLSRAATPLLLVEGEFDDDPREMEEVYSILYGSGVPAVLAYYWGEAHVFASRGNIRDSWIRTEQFFRRYLQVT